MPDDYNLAFVNPYNEKIRERNRLLDHMDIITHNPEMLGGGRIRERPLSGNNGAYPMDHTRLMELQAMGGAFNVTKFLRPTMKVLKSKEAQEIIKPLTKAAVNMAVKKMGGINRYKKASKWLGFTTKALSSGLDLASKAKALSGYGELENVVKKVRRVKKVLEEPMVQEVVSHLRKAPVVKRVEKKVKSVVGGGRAQRASIVKKIMAERGVGMIQASSIVKREGLY